jgi:hypothetical protein
VRSRCSGLVLGCLDHADVDPVTEVPSGGGLQGVGASDRARGDSTGQLIDRAAHDIVRSRSSAPPGPLVHEPGDQRILLLERQRDRAELGGDTWRRGSDPGADGVLQLGTMVCLLAGRD